MEPIVIDEVNYLNKRQAKQQGKKIIDSLRPAFINELEKKLIK